MAAKKFIVELDADQRARLNALISKGKAPAKTIVEALDTNLTMIMRVREKLVTEGFDAVLTRKKRGTPPTPAIFDGAGQAKLIALACSKPPPGYARSILHAPLWANTSPFWKHAGWYTQKSSAG